MHHCNTLAQWQGAVPKSVDSFGSDLVSTHKRKHTARPGVLELTDGYHGVEFCLTWSSVYQQSKLVLMGCWNIKLVPGSGLH